MDTFFDHRAPSIVTDIAEYRNGFIDIRTRGGKIRCFTEINRENCTSLQGVNEVG